MKRLDVGQLFTLTQDALEVYGEEYKDVVFEIVEWYDSYLPGYSKNWDNHPHSHPGYDEEAAYIDGCIYDVKIEGEADTFGNSLYRWEMNVIEEDNDKIPQ